MGSPPPIKVSGTPGRRRVGRIFAGILSAGETFLWGEGDPIMKHRPGRQLIVGAICVSFNRAISPGHPTSSITEWLLTPCPAAARIRYVTASDAAL